jgi:hypothetical protein
MYTYVHPDDIPNLNPSEINTLTGPYPCQKQPDLDKIHSCTFGRCPGFGGCEWIAYGGVEPE